MSLLSEDFLGRKEKVKYQPFGNVPGKMNGGDERRLKRDGADTGWSLSDYYPVRTRRLIMSKEELK